MAAAHAQGGDASAIAEQLFSRGRELAKANQWTDACPKFEASLHYDPLLGTRLNLAACYEHIGRLASAWGLYREAIDLAREAGDTKRRDYAQQQAALLEPRLAKLAISAPARPPAGFVVSRDNLQIEPGAFRCTPCRPGSTQDQRNGTPASNLSEQTVTSVEGKTDDGHRANFKRAPAPTPGLSSGPGNDTVSDSPPVKPSPTQSSIRTDAANVPSTWSDHLPLGMGLAGATAISLGLLYGLNANTSYNDAKCYTPRSCAAHRPTTNKANSSSATRVRMRPSPRS